jgi:hypothetical protein
MNCSCHGEPMRWQADRRRKAKGYWVCYVKYREGMARYERSDKGRATHRRYRDSEKGHVTERKVMLNQEMKLREQRAARFENQLDVSTEELMF